jgi:hypothetical protein
MFTLRIIGNPYTENATLLTVKEDGTYNCHSALKA